jgi:5-methyltetrahydrofolate--homocysteine methyltransferase
MGTVAGDIHDVGKNLVDVMLEGAGFEVIDLGINVPAERFVEAIREHRPDVVGMSAFLTTTALEFERNIELIRDAGLRDEVKILIGGAPVDQALVERVGADGTAPDASSAVRVTKAMLGIA